MKGTSFVPLDLADPTRSRVLGQYTVAAVSGATTGLSAGNPILSFRWTDTVAMAVFTRITASAVINTAFGTAQAIDIDAIIARSFTVVDSGGTAITIGASNPKNQSGMGPSLVADLRIATTGTLTAGTRTLDSNPIASLAFGGNSNALGNADTRDLYLWNRNGQYPIVLSANEGLILRVPTAQGATGKVVYYITLEWAEVHAAGLWLT